MGHRIRSSEAVSAQSVPINFDRNMIVALLRNWRPNRLRPQPFLLAKERPRLIRMQGGNCLVCKKLLLDEGKATPIDHTVTVKEFAAKVTEGVLAFDEAYRQLWADSNLRALCRACNYNLNKKGKNEV
jgi:hypothetical protein